MTKKKQHLLSSIVVIALAIGYYFSAHQNAPVTNSSVNKTVQPLDSGLAPHKTLQDYYEHKTSGDMVTVKASVVRLLTDDNKGSRHQRFIIELNNGQSILVAHNIDLAPRVELLQVGSEVIVKGQYEWNERGGVIHWTHHDPKGNRDGGYINYKGKVYR
ncbi:DUF3465 domain-containing protein [Kangiella marina]|uniref:DUF3465 domain-containing protein n=1 Tax=Kangiella marina TaxID=1079178 RepID=A0ABP8IBJ0_9GAMM